MDCSVSPPEHKPPPPPPASNAATASGTTGNSSGQTPTPTATSTSVAGTLRKQKFHYGLVSVSDGKCRPQPARLKVCPDLLVLQREEFVFPEEGDPAGIDNKLRTIRLRRQPDGSLGFSIKGGSEHNLPILVSKVCMAQQQQQQRDSARKDSSSAGEDDTGTPTVEEEDDHFDQRAQLQQLYVGDAVVKVNHTSLVSVSHDEAINILRNAGPAVTLAVMHYRSAAPFLLRNLRQLVPEHCEPTNIADPADDLLDGNRNSMSRKSSCPTATTATTSTSAAPHPGIQLGSPAESVASDGGGGAGRANNAASPSATWHGIVPRVRRKWIDVVEVPLLMSYVTRYIFGTDRLRANSFEVRGMNGANSGVIHVADPALLSNWIKLVTDYVNALNAYKGSQFNRQLAPSEQISYMSWVGEGVLNRNQPWQNWRPKFFALRGADVCIFNRPPLELSDWFAQPGSDSQTYKVYEAMFRVLKESENVDERQHCFLIQTAGQESRYFSMETRAELLRLESAWHRAVCSTVSQIRHQTFHVVYRHLPAAFTMDWAEGFLLRPFASPEYHFAYSFSQLKNSRDDGAAKLTLVFQEPHGGLVEHELICPKLQSLLFFMHSFLTAKVASLDPSFLNRGRLA